jgi:hypothetical protein
MGLGDDWRGIEPKLPADWIDVRLRFTVADPPQLPRAAALLGPLQPVALETGALTLRIARGGSPGPEALRRALKRLDSERIGGRLDLIAYGNRPATALEEPAPPSRLPGEWDAALATIPADWSDVLGELELASSDYVDRAAVHLVPINPRRQGLTLRLQFRCARRFGYGASPGMVRRSLERCDADGIRGSVQVLRVLSDTDPVGTQGPVWHIAGQMV